MAIEISFPKNFNDVILEARKERGSYHGTTSFDIETGERIYFINNAMRSVRYYENHKSAVYLNRDDSLIVNQKHNFIHGKRFRTVQPFILKEPSGRKVPKTAIPENVWFYYKTDINKMFMIVEDSETGLFSMTQNGEFEGQQGFEIFRANTATRKINRENFHQIINEKILENALLDKGDVEFEYTHFMSTEDTNKINQAVSTLKSLNTEEIFNLDSIYFEIYFKRQKYIPAGFNELKTIEWHPKIRGHSGRFFAAMKDFEKHYVDYRHPQKVPYLEVCYD